MITEPASSRTGLNEEQRPVAPILQLEEVRITLAGTPVIDGVDLALEEGELAVLSGPNGAGKSTLLRAIANLLPFRGQILIAGHHPASLEARERFAFVPDEPALYEDLTLREHVRFTSLLYGQSADEAATLEWLDTFRLTPRLDEYPSTHSRGMRQKLSLALALGLRTGLLLLDEPYNGLDFEAQELLGDGLQEQCDAGKTVLLTGHQPGLASRLSAREIPLDDGRATETDA